MPAISWRAGPAIRTRRLRPAGKLAPGGGFGRYVFVNFIQECVEPLLGFHGHLVAASCRAETFLRGTAEQFEFGSVFLFALLQKPEAFLYHQSHFLAKPQSRKVTQRKPRNPLLSSLRYSASLRLCEK
jgi:hypothetical protein